MEGLLKIIIFLLLLLIFGGWLIVAIVAALGVAGIFIGIAFAVMAIGAAISFMHKHGILQKIGAQIMKLENVPFCIKLRPYLKWIMLACDLFFILTLYFRDQEIYGFVFVFFIFCLILQLIFKEYKDIRLTVGGYWVYLVIRFMQNRYYFSIASMIVSVLVAMVSGYVIFKIGRTPKSPELQVEAEEKATADKKLRLIPFAVVILIFVISQVSVQTSPLTRYHSAIEKMNVEKAVAAFAKLENPASNISGLTDMITTYKEEFIAGEIDLDTVLEKFKVLGTIPELTESIALATLEVGAVYSSREAFVAAGVAEESKDVMTAMKQYKKVVSADEANYAIASEKIETLTAQLKKTTMTSITAKVRKDDFVGAMEIINETEDLLSKDSEYKQLAGDVKGKFKDILLGEINAKLAEDDLESAKVLLEGALVHFPDDSTLTKLSTSVDDDIYTIKVNTAYNEQLAYVTTVSIVAQDEEYKTIYPDLVSISVFNKSDKTIKNITAEYRLYDKSGYLLEIKNANSDTALVTSQKVKMTATIAPEEAYEDTSTQLDSSMTKIARIDACVVDIEFEDGTKWSSDYYPLWKDAAGTTRADAPSSTKTSSSSSGSSSYSSKTKTADEETDFEKYLKENDMDSYNYYQELEERWDTLAESSGSGSSSSGSYSSGGYSSKTKTNNNETDFEKYLKENDTDSYNYYQQLESQWDSLD